MYMKKCFPLGTQCSYRRSLPYPAGSLRGIASLPSFPGQIIGGVHQLQSSEDLVFYTTKNGQRYALSFGLLMVKILLTETKLQHLYENCGENMSNAEFWPYGI